MQAIPTVRFRDGAEVPALGQGTWRMGEDASLRRAEIAALREGVELGQTLIDTAEMYGKGEAERVVGEAIRGLDRDRLFLVSKVYPHNATRRGVEQACERSVARLGVEALDLYLLHWRGGVKLAETVEGFERLRARGLIGRWGVSNFDVSDLEELGPSALDACAANQVLWNLEARGVEFDLLPFCAARAMPVMAYSPLGRGGAMLGNPALRRVAARHGADPSAVALAFALARPGVVAIPKAATAAHLRRNRAAVGLALGAEDLAELDSAFPPPRRKRALEMI
jgi:diketogulonate reductase-like aldo/keto reductase